MIEQLQIAEFTQHPDARPFCRNPYCHRSTDRIVRIFVGKYILLELCEDCWQ
jgi:hypothetical protein